MGEFEFDRAVAMDPDGNGHLHDGWDINGNANGGYLLALAGNGMRTIAGRPDPVSVTAHYLAPGKPGDVHVDASVVKHGRRFTTVTGALRTRERTLLQLVGTFGDLAGASGAGAAYMAGGPPDLPPMDDCMPRTASGVLPIEFAKRLDVRIRPEDTGFLGVGDKGRAEMAGYLTFADGRPIDTLALLLVADAFAPAVFNLDLDAGWVPTVEMTVHVRGVPAPGPVRCMFRTRYVSGGMFEEDGEIWDSDGQLVALSRQLALLPLLP